MVAIYEYEAATGEWKEPLLCNKRKELLEAQAVGEKAAKGYKGTVLLYRK